MVQKCFDRDRMLMEYYNKGIASGKWDGMMIQKHIGYTSWNDNFPADTMPEVFRLDEAACRPGGYTFDPTEGAIVIEAEHFSSASAPDNGAKWEVIPHMGRTLSGVAVRPYTVSPEGAVLKYGVTLPENTDSVRVHVITKSTLAFDRKEGHRYSVGFEGAEPVVINFNGDMNEEPENIYTKFYPVIARRVIEKTVDLKTASNGGNAVLELKPLDPGVVFEKIVIDLGGYTPSYLFGKETPHHRKR